MLTLLVNQFKLSSGLRERSFGELEGKDYRTMTALLETEGSEALISRYGLAWLDNLGLNDAAEFVELIETSPQIMVICAGHVHQEFAGQIGATTLYTTPSTCVQFAARNEKAFDTTMAGYRTIVLEQDGYHTEVHRLSD